MSLKKIILGIALTSTLGSAVFSQTKKSQEAYEKATFFQTENIDSTIYYLRKSIGYEGENIKAHRLLAAKYLEKGEDINAMISLIDCLGMNEEVPELKNKLDSIWKTKKSPESSLDKFIEKVDEESLYLVGDSLKKAGNTFKKIRYENKKLGLEIPELSVDIRGIYYGFAKTIIDSMIYKNNEEIAEPYVRKAKAYENHKMYTQALVAYSRAIESNPLNPEYPLRKGMVYQKLNYENKAINQFKEVVKIDPDNVIANTKLGTYYLKRRDYEKALINLTSAILSKDKLEKPY